MGPETYSAGGRRVEASGSGREIREAPDLVIVYAGTNPSRLRLLEHVTRRTDFPVVSVPGGDEDPNDDVLDISSEKVQHAKKIARDVREFNPSDRLAIIAADVKSRPYMLDKNGHRAQFSLPRPRNAEEIRETMAGMIEAADQDKKNASHTPSPFYTIESGSYGIITQPRRRAIELPKGPNSMSIELYRSKLERMVESDKRFWGYLDEAEKFYSSPEYTDGGKVAPITAPEIASGLSIEAFLRLKAVRSINGVHVNSPDFRRLARRAIYFADVGIHPNTLGTLIPESGRLIESWPYTDRTTALALRENE